MIDRFSDHASNERTMLAWIRTGIAFIAFGFVLEKFHIVLKHFVALTPATVTDISIRDTRMASEALVIFGLVTIMGALIRFIKTTKEISSPQAVEYSPWAATIIGVGFFCLGCVILLGMLNW